MTAIKVALQTIEKLLLTGNDILLMAMTFALFTCFPEGSPGYTAIPGRAGKRVPTDKIHNTDLPTCHQEVYFVFKSIGKPPSGHVSGHACSRCCTGYTFR